MGLPFLATPAGFPPDLARKFAVFHSLVLFVVIAAISKKNTISCEPQCAPSADRWVALVHDASVTIAILGVSYFACVPATEAGDAVVDDLRVKAQADSVLNHILKNSMASVSAILEIELMKGRLPKEAAENESTTTSTAISSSLWQDSRGMLESALSELQRAMTWIVSRQVLMAVASESYVTTMSPVDLTLLFNSVATGEKFKFHDATLAFTHAVPNSCLQIAFDEKMARLALENGVTNAVQHGDGGKVEIGAEFRNEGFFYVLFLSACSYINI
jgi:signal transduction histidine kinase